MIETSLSILKMCLIVTSTFKLFLYVELQAGTKIRIEYAVATLNSQHLCNARHMSTYCI